jgi:hypothetical protein
MGPLATAESDPPILERADAVRIRVPPVPHVGLDERREIRDLIQGAMQCHAQTTFRLYRCGSATWVKIMLCRYLTEARRARKARQARLEVQDVRCEIWDIPYPATRIPYPLVTRHSAI